MAEYYEQRAGAGIIMTEATPVSEEAGGWRNAPHMSTAEHAAAWKKIVDRVHAKDGIIYLQLWHIGRQSHSSFHPATNRIVSASPIPIVAQTKATFGMADAEVPHELTKEEIQQVIADFVNAAELAKEAGFDGVCLHSANGYLIDCFFQSCSNQRTDEYGGNPENRCRFVKEIIEGIIASGAFPANRIGFRISPNGTFGEMGSDDNDVTFLTIAKIMNQFGLAFLDVMDGLGFGYHNKCPALTCMDLKKVWDGPLICNVGLTRDAAEGMIRSGAADLCSFGRLYISNPDLVDRFANNWPVEPEAPYETWWQPGTNEKGYTDWPTYKEIQKDDRTEQENDAQ